MNEVEQAKQLFQLNLPILSALGDATRQELIVLMLDGDPKTVQELARLVDISRPAVSHHIKILREAGVVKDKRVGMKRYYYPDIGDGLESIKRLIAAIEIAGANREMQIVNLEISPN